MRGRGFPSLHEVRLGSQGGTSSSPFYAEKAHAHFI
jgi:hypothetical protein